MKTLTAPAPAAAAAKPAPDAPLCTVDEHTNGHILYQGERVPATFVSEINLRRSEGMDMVVRDQAGRYYLHRKIYTDQDGYSLPPDDRGQTRPRYTRHFLHRLSHGAMALWMIETSGGSRRVRRDAAPLWQQPASKAAALPETMPLVPLGPQASRVLAALCRRYRVKRESVLQSIVEQFLSDGCQDISLFPVVADEARLIKRTGHVPASWWAGVALNGEDLQTKEVA